MITWPEYPIGWQIVWWALVAFTIFAIVRAWMRLRARTPGMRFPAGHRVDGIKRGLRARLVHLPLGLRSVALPLLVFALSRPQVAQEDTAEVEGIDIVIALDVSGSMATIDISDEDLVRLQNKDMEPKDRFTSATEVVRDFIKTRKYDRVSLVVFGKQAFLQFPLTLDYGVMLSIVDRMALNDVDGGATVIGNALAMSVARLRDSKAKTRLIVLLTDGEDNGSNISPLEMAKEAGERGIKIFPILVGTEDQSRQPVGEMVDAFTGHRIYKKVDNKVNPKLLQDIAEVASGQFYHAGDKEKLARDFLDIIDRFEKSRLVDYAAADRTELFPWFLLPGLFLLLVEILLSQTWLRRFP